MVQDMRVVRLHAVLDRLIHAAKNATLDDSAFRLHAVKVLRDAGYVIRRRKGVIV